MQKRLIIAEKPSVGQDIARVLGCKLSKDGCFIGDSDIVTWAVGHLVEQCTPDELNPRYAEWRREDLPIIPEEFRLKVIKHSAQQFDIVKSLMNDPQIDHIVCATDAGREGELIFRYIYQMAGCEKPVERLWISSLTYRAIKEGFENLKPSSEYDNLYESARCRSEADWLIGMNGSRAFAIENKKRHLSIGRVTSPTLAILVDRELERRYFKPQQFLEVIAEFDGYEGRLINPEKEDSDTWSWFSPEQVSALERYVNHHSPRGRIILSDSKEESIPPLLLYDLTSLQRDANRLFGMSSKKTLEAAQNLYEKYKAITYPRTDSRFLTVDIKSTFEKRLESLSGGDLGAFAKKALTSQRDLFGRFLNNKGVSDHHAIIPTGEARDIEKWSDQEKKVFELIARRFVAMFLPDRRVLHRTVKTIVDGKTFLSTGEKVISIGWSEVDTTRNSTVHEIPDLRVGAEIPVLNMRIRKDETKPPAHHTEASLLAAMEHAGKILMEDSLDDEETEFGIGTPATRAATIEKLISEEMVMRQGRALRPTDYGIKLISILPEFLRSPELTGEWEAKLARIGKGTESPDRFMQGIINLTRELVDYAKRQGNTGLKDSLSVGPCPFCGSPVKEYSDSYYCANKTCVFRKVFKARPGQPTIDRETMKKLLSDRVADTEKGQYTIIHEPPYIAFKRAEKAAADFTVLQSLIKRYGLKTINKVPSGGALWIAGDKDNAKMVDFVNDCKKLGFSFAFTADSRALKHKSGWYLRIEDRDKERFMKVFV